MHNADERIHEVLVDIRDDIRELIKQGEENASPPGGLRGRERAEGDAAGRAAREPKTSDGSARVGDGTDDGFDGYHYTSPIPVLRGVVPEANAEARVLPGASGGTTVLNRGALVEDLIGAVNRVMPIAPSERFGGQVYLLRDLLIKVLNMYLGEK